MAMLAARPACLNEEALYRESTVSSAEFIHRRGMHEIMVLEVAWHCFGRQKKYIFCNEVTGTQLWPSQY